MDNIILIICFILIAIIFIKQNRNTIQEKFATVPPAVQYTTQQYINNAYGGPIDSIRMLADKIKGLLVPNITLPTAVDVLGDVNKMPYNTIAMWYGSKIPDGWIECNGQLGTPNLSANKMSGLGQFPIIYIMRSRLAKLYGESDYNFFF